MQSRFDPGRFAAKLAEAERHLDRMREERDARDQRSFQDEFRAFLSSARSVVQYVYEESEAKELSGKYKDLVTGQRPCLFPYFKALRDSDVHREPVNAIPVIAGKSLIISGKPGPGPSRGGKTPAPILVGVGPVAEWRLPESVVDKHEKRIPWPCPDRREVFQGCSLYLDALRKLLDEASEASCIVLP